MISCISKLQGSENNSSWQRVISDDKKVWRLFSHFDLVDEKKNSKVPHSTKQLPESVVTYHHRCSVAFSCAIAQAVLKILICNYQDYNPTYQGQISWNGRGIIIKSPRSGVALCFQFVPPRPRPPRPRLQKLFPPTSKPFELNLWYSALTIYGSGEMYLITFPWPWPKVTAVALISKNLLVCVIKWEPLIESLQNIPYLLPWSWSLPD